MGSAAPRMQDAGRRRSEAAHPPLVCAYVPVECGIALQPWLVQLMADSNSLGSNHQPPSSPQPRAITASISTIRPPWSPSTRCFFAERQCCPRPRAEPSRHRRPRTMPPLSSSARAPRLTRATRASLTMVVSASPPSSSLSVAALILTVSFVSTLPVETGWDRRRPALSRRTAEAESLQRPIPEPTQR